MRINEDIRKSAFFIGVQDDKGDFVPFGTGFLVGWFPGGFSFVVTAKHVIEDAAATKRPVLFRVNKKSGGAHLGQFAGPWYHHPTIPKCDIAVAGVAISHDTFDIKYCGLPRGALSDDYIRKNDVGCGDEVFVTGLLARHFGKTRNIPIVRMGNIAAMPEEPVDLGEYGHQEVYLIESRSIGGLSGSPVFLNTPPFRIVDTQITQADGHQRDYLMGVNIGLFKAQPLRDSVPSEPMAHREEFLELMSSGIAVVVPVQRIIEIIQSAPIKDIMERSLAKLHKNSDFVPTSAANSINEVTADRMATPTAANNPPNPRHKEDFTSLLDAAAKKQTPDH